MHHHFGYKTIKKIGQQFLTVSLILFGYSSVSFGYEATLEDGSLVSLHGIGTHQEKRIDIYIGALFSAQEFDATSQLLNPEINRRMSFKFLSKYSNRKMARFWKQRIAMNNARDKWRPFTKEIVSFANIFKSAIQPGDEINLDYIAGKGTQVYLNGTLFSTIKAPEFYNLLINIWIGTIPPTESFKLGITGNNEEKRQTQLVSQYQSIETIKGRFDADKPAQSKPIGKVASSTNKKSSTKKDRAKALSKSSQSINQTKTNTLPKSNTKVANETQQLVESLKVDLPASSGLTEKPQIELPRTNKEEIFGQSTNKTPINNISNEAKAIISNTEPPPIEGNSLAEQAQTKNLSPKKSNSQDKIAKLETADDTFFDVDLFSGAYTLELIKQIRKYQNYPKKALRGAIEGSLTISVIIDEQGELVGTDWVQRSGSRILDRAAMKMVRKATPYPKIPSELGQKTFEFEVPMNFSLTD